MSLVGSKHVPRPLAWVAILLVGLPAYVFARDVDGRVFAHVASAIAIRDKAPVTLVRSSDITLVEEGHASGTLPGRVQVRITIATTTASSTVTLYPRGGSISAGGTLHVHPGRRNNTYESFSGSLSVHHGTGRFAHASGSGNIYGVLNRNNDNAEVQVIGTLYY